MQNGFWMWLGVGMWVFKKMVLAGMAQKQCLWCYHSKRKLLLWAAQQVKIWSTIMIIHWLHCCRKKRGLNPHQPFLPFRPILPVRRWDVLWTQSQYYKSLSFVISEETLCFNACLLASAILCDCLISCSWLLHSKRLGTTTSKHKFYTMCISAYHYKCKHSSLLCQYMRLLCPSLPLRVRWKRWVQNCIVVTTTEKVRIELYLHALLWECMA